MSFRVMSTIGAMFALLLVASAAPAGTENLHEGLPLHHHHLAPARAPAAEPSFGLVPAPAPAAYKQTPQAHTHAPAAEPPFGYTPSAPHRGTFYSSARAPAPAAPAADTLFMLSARRATLTEDDGLFLAGVLPEVLSFNLVGRAHVIETRDFAERFTSPDSRFVAPSGKWLDHPIAVLKGTSNDNGKTLSALVTLAASHYDASAHTLHFKAKFLQPVSATPLPTSGGAAGRLINDVADGLAAVVLDAPAQQGARFTNVGLFIDHNSMHTVKLTPVVSSHNDKQRSDSQLSG